ncbi:MAG TPA: hypothetical protein VGQ03_08580 [Nitrososphaera sp.]|jgi:hypothetical protein|nr:hypothetical protein [Nitrososphaera sp.]
MCVFAKADNFRLFIAAKAGIKYSPTFVEKMELSRKRYYNSLSELNRHGLLRRNPATGMSVYTVFGEMIYRCISDMSKYARHIEELRMIDALQHTGTFTPDRIMKLLEKLGDDEKIVKNIFGTFEMVWSYKAMVSVLLEHIRGANTEILVATRLLSEEVIRALLAKATHGVKIRILSDVSLVESYFAMQKLPVDSSASFLERSERIEVVGNPWYPDKLIERRIACVPFGMVILDGVEVGIEMVDAHKPHEFSGGIIVQDRSITDSMKDFYYKLWFQAEEFTDFYKGKNKNPEA